MREERQATDDAREGRPDLGGAHRSGHDAGTDYDIVISGGEVIDPGTGRFDVDGRCRRGERRLVNRLTLAGGTKLSPGSLGDQLPWIPAEAAW